MVYSSKRKETQNKIDAAFMELFKSNPNLPINVKSICRLADINRSTFYTYYKDVYDLQECIAERTQNRFIAELKRIIFKLENFDINVITKELVIFFQDNIDLLFLFVKQSKENYLESVLKLAMDDNLFSNISNMSEKDFRRLNIAIKYHVTGLINVLDSCFTENEPFDLEEIIGLLAELGDNGAFSIVKEYAFRDNVL